jgi:hypothetical protein
VNKLSRKLEPGEFGNKSDAEKLKYRSESEWLDELEKHCTTAIYRFSGSQHYFPNCMETRSLVSRDLSLNPLH